MSLGLFLFLKNSLKLLSELVPEIAYSSPFPLLPPTTEGLKKDLLFKTKLHDVQIKKTEIFMHIW
jgi:hypothetical protein